MKMKMLSAVLSVILLPVFSPSKAVQAQTAAQAAE